MEKRDIQRMNNDVINYFKDNKVSNPSACLKNGTLILDKKIFSYSVMVDIVLTVLLIFLFFSIDDTGYKILIVIGGMIISYTLFVEFESINYVEINFSTRVITIIPKNIIKRKTVILFSEIEHMEINSKFYKSQFRRYRIKMKTNENDNILLTDFNSEKNALFFIGYLRTIIK